MEIKTALAHLANKKNLSAAEMEAAMHIIMSGQASDAQIGAFLMGLRSKGETVEEVVGAAKIIRELATPVKIQAPYLIDIVGTGGDGARTFNVSTTAAFVIAAAGATVAKHNNRAVSGHSGSADVLEIAGIKTDLTAAQVQACIEKIGIGFMFAPNFHSSWRYAANPRRELGLRTIFNLLGPLVNPAAVPNQVIGVFAKEWVMLLAEAFKKLGGARILVVHAQDGLDEISIAAPTDVAELKNGEISTYELTPEQFNITRADSLHALQVENSVASYELMQTVLNNKPGPARDIVVLNAGAAIYVSGLVNNLAEGIALADNVIAQGKAEEKFEALKQFTNTLK